jgi:hypothetical protein
MPRANRHFLTGCIWHITHRCQQKAIPTEVSAGSSSVFALGFPSQEAVRSLRIELYADIEPRTSVSEAHSEDVIAQSMQLIAVGGFAFLENVKSEFDSKAS